MSLYFWEISLLYGILQDLRVSSVCLCIETALTTLYKSCSWTSYATVQQHLKSSKFAVVLFQASVQHVVLLITMLINKLDPQKQFSPLHCFMFLKYKGFKSIPPAALLSHFQLSKTHFFMKPQTVRKSRKFNFICSCFMQLSSRLLVNSRNIHTQCVQQSSFILSEISSISV